MYREPINQEQFNIAYLGLYAQDFRHSRHETPSGTVCLYRGPDDCRCAVGHMIPDSDYRPEYDEGAGAYVGEIEGYLTGILKADLQALQNCHDYAKDAFDMQIRLGEFARDRGFTIPTLPQETQP